MLFRSEVAARAAYHTIDISILHYAKLILSFKERVVEERAKTAPPTVSQNDLDEYWGPISSESYHLSKRHFLDSSEKNSIISKVR